MVTEWKDRGRIALHGDQVDVEASDKMLADTFDPTRRPRGRPPKKKTEVAAENEQTTATYAEVRTITEKFRAKQAELAYRREVGELCERARVDHGVGDAFGIVGRALDQIADRLSARLAGESDQRKVHALLTAEMDAAKAQLANAIASLPETLLATRQ